MKKIWAASILLSSLLISSLFAQGTVTIFGPRVFERSTGKPVTVTVPFSRGADAVSPFTMIVTNGAANGSNRVSSATIKINGATLFSQSDFNQQVPQLSKPVTLAANNVLEVQLSSKPGSYLTINITATNISTAPVITIFSPLPDIITSQSQVTVTGKVEGTAGTTATINDLPLPLAADGTFSALVPLSLEGINSIRVKAFSASGLESEMTRTVIHDTQPPTLVMSTPEEGKIIASANTEVTGTVSDNSPVMLKVNDIVTPFDSLGHYIQNISLTEGVNTITAVAIDAAGNQATITRSVRRDSQAPVLTVTQPEDGLITNQTTIPIIGTVTDESSITVVINGNQINLESGGILNSTIPLLEGLNTITIIAKDTVNNQTSVTRTVRRDTQSPIVNIQLPNDSTITNQQTVEIRGTAIDSTTVTLTINGIAVSLGTGGEFSYQLPVAEGMNSVALVATDAAGNEKRETIHVRRDTQSPVINLTSPADSLVTSLQSVAISGTVLDSTAVSVTINGNNVPVGVGGVFSYQLSVVEGLNTMTVVATDAAGNQTTVSRLVTRDSQSPVVNLTSPVDSLITNLQSISVSGIISDSTAVNLTVNGTSVQLGISGAFSTQVTLTEGPNNIELIATDKAGNSSTVTRFVNRDSQPPIVNITSPIDSLITNQSNVIVSGNVKDSTAVILTINGSIVTIGTDGSFSSQIVLVEGSNTILITATDAASNITTNSKLVVRDSQSPVITVISPLDSTFTNSSTTAVSGTVTDSHLATLTIGGSTIIVSPEGSYSTQVNLTEGSNIISVVATDKAGNSSSLSRLLIRDSQSPVITLAAPIDSLITGLQTVMISGTVTDANFESLKIQEISVPVDSAGTFSLQLNLNEGLNTFNIVSADKAGNTTTISRLTIRDSQSPIVNLTAPVNNLITKQSAIAVSGNVVDSTAVILKINGIGISVGADGAFNTTTNLIEGRNTISVVATDAAGNIKTDSISVTRDSQPPIVTLTSPNDSLITKFQSITVSGTVTDEHFASLKINDSLVTVDSTGTYSIQHAINEGSNSINIVATDEAGNTTTVSRLAIRDTQSPIITLTSPIDSLITKLTKVVISGSISDSSATTITINGIMFPIDASGTFADTLGLSEGKNYFTLIATDTVGNQTTVTRMVVRDTQAPAITILSPAQGSKTMNPTVIIQGSVIDSNSVSLTINSLPQLIGSDGIFSMQFTLAEGWNEIVLAATDIAGNSTISTLQVRKISLPPDPSLIAPKLDSTVIAVPMAKAVEFLYKNQTPVQTDIDTTKLNQTCIGVVRGRVTKLDGSALSGVTITMSNHPEFGQTLSRADGMFDMVVNGSSNYALSYEKDGYFSASRNVEIGCNLFVYAETVALIQPDTQVTAISFTQPIEVAKSTIVQDADGQRQVVVAFPQGTEAQMVLENDSVVTLPEIHVRATEYTVGPNGPNAMPLPLPPTSGYTYCTNLTADEALSAKAKLVRFSRPIMFYVDNFIGFPVGMRIPCGRESFKIEKGTLIDYWLPFEDGRVIQIVNIVNGCAQIAVDSAGYVSDTARLAAFGINEAERCYLATLYGPGQSIMRTSVNYFGQYDLNLGVIAPDGAEEPMAPVPPALSFEQKYPSAVPSGSVQSISNVLNQKMERDVPVTGAPFSLHYTSEWQTGRRAELFIKVSNDTLPPEALRIVVEVNTAGRITRDTLPAQPNQTYHYIWDGKDSYGREVTGEHTAQVRIGYMYHGAYQAHFGLVKNFALTTGKRLPQIRSRQEVTLFQQLPPQTLETIDGRNLGAGGWTISEKNELNPEKATLYLGNGQEKKLSTIGTGVQRIPATGQTGYLSWGGYCYCGFGDIEQAPDGSIYVLKLQSGMTSPTYGKIVRIAPDHVASLVLGDGPSYADSIPASQGVTQHTSGMAFDAQGNLYFSEGYPAPTEYNRIRKIDRDGIVSTIAGSYGAGFSGDGGPARLAKINNPSDVSVSASGNIYIADMGNNRIRCIGTDGTINTAAGGGTITKFTDGMIASSFKLPSPQKVAVGKDGNVYIAFFNSYAAGSSGVQSIIKLGTDGRLYLCAGVLKTTPRDDSMIPEGSVARETCIGTISSLIIDDKGLVNFTTGRHYGLFQIDGEGKIRTIVGGGNSSYYGNYMIGKPAREIDAGVGNAIYGKYGTLYFTSVWDNTPLFQIAPITLAIVNDKYEVPSLDGSEIYTFDNAGRHIQTRNALTQRMIMTFRYDVTGRLSEVMDKDSLVSHIDRDPSGNITGIVSPKGEHTQLVTDSTGMLSSISNPNGEQVRFRYSEGGLMSSIISPTGGEQTMSYDSSGRLVSAATAETPASQLTKTQTTDGYNITSTSPTGIQSTVNIAQTPSGAQTLTGTDPYGRQTTANINPSGIDSVKTPDGSIVITERSYDPRFGAQVPIASKTTVRTPSGLTSVQTQTRTISLMVGSEVKGITDVSNINGRAFTTVWDGNARTNTQTSQEGRKKISYLSTKDQVIKDSIPGLAAKYYAYDAEGRITQTRQAGRITTYSYDNKGRLLSTRDPIGRKDSMFYDDAGRVVRQVFPDGNAVLYYYDSNGNMLGLTPPGKPMHTFAYDRDNKLVNYLPPIVDSDTSATIYAYDQEGRLKQTVYPDNTLLTVTYDAVDGKQKAITYDFGTTSVAYDSLTGNIKQISTTSDTLSYTYDGSLPLSETWHGVVNTSVKIKYDNSLRKVYEAIGNTDSIKITYDRDDLPTRIGKIGMKYNAANNFLLSDTVGNTINEYTYDTYGDLATKKTKVGTNVLYQVAYTRDSLARVTQKDETVSGVLTKLTYKYETSGRLSEVKRNDTLVSTYSYDPNGNRLSHWTPSKVDSGAYDLQDRLVSYSSTRYSYTASGNLKFKVEGIDTTRYTYDNLGNLLSVSLPDGNLIEYCIDGSNRRIAKKLNGQIISKWIYSGGLLPIAELDSANKIVARYVGDYLLKSDTTYRIVKDNLGSTRFVLNAQTGIVVQEINYDEFGNIIKDTNPGFIPFYYAGGFYDNQTKLIRFGARDYDASIGRWTISDPMGFSGGDANLYGYCSQDPINKYDRNGQRTGSSEVATLSQTSVIVGQSIAGSALLFDMWLDIILPMMGPTVYRVHSTIAENDVYGHWWTTMPPALSENYRSEAGLPNENTGQYLSVGKLVMDRDALYSSATPIHEGQKGGWPQIYVPNPRLQIHLIKTVKLAQPY